MPTYNTSHTPKRPILWVMTVMMIVPVAHADHQSSSPGHPLSRAFDGPMWSLVAPGGAATVSDGHLLLAASSVGDGTLVGTNRLVRLLQPIANVDFDISIKIDSPMDGQEAEQGVMIATDDNTFVTFEMKRDADGIRLSAHSIAEGVSMTILDGVTLPQESKSMCLRLQREQVEYHAYYSTDGETWTLAGAFDYTPSSAFVGPFIGYDLVTPEAVPAVMSVDWFKVQQ